NLSYLEQVTHDPGPNVLFVRAAGDPTALARQVATATGRYGTNVKDIRRQTTQTVSSITTVDLRGISRIEEAFVLALAAATMALYVAVALAGGLIAAALTTLQIRRLPLGAILREQ